MRNTCLVLAAIAMLCSCTKKETTLTNYIGNTNPSFTVSGVNDVSITNNVSTATLGLYIAYEDSAQQKVTIAFKGLPADILIDTPWTSEGYPTFGSNVTLYSADGGAIPGRYIVNLTVTAASGVVRSYPFTLTVNPMPTAFLGKYENCYSTCVSGLVYPDSLYMDPVVPNKVWFSNFLYSHQAVYSFISDGVLYIPAQSVAGMSISGQANIILSEHNPITVNYQSGGSASCILYMNN